MAPVSASFEELCIGGSISTTVTTADGQDKRYGILASMTCGIMRPTYSALEETLIYT